MYSPNSLKNNNLTKHLKEDKLFSFWQKLEEDSPFFPGYIVYPKQKNYQIDGGKFAYFGP